MGSTRVTVVIADAFLCPVMKQLHMWAKVQMSMYDISDKVCDWFQSRPDM